MKDFRPKVTNFRCVTIPVTHRDQVKAVHAAKQSSLERAAALFTESYLAFVRKNSRLLPRIIRRITKTRNR